MKYPPYRDDRHCGSWEGGVENTPLVNCRLVMAETLMVVTPEGVCFPIHHQDVGTILARAINGLIPTPLWVAMVGTDEWTTTVVTDKPTDTTPILTYGKIPDGSKITYKTYRGVKVTHYHNRKGNVWRLTFPLDPEIVVDEEEIAYFDQDGEVIGVWGRGEMLPPDAIVEPGEVTLAHDFIISADTSVDMWYRVDDTTKGGSYLDGDTVYVRHSAGRFITLPHKEVLTPVAMTDTSSLAFGREVSVIVEYRFSDLVVERTY